MNKSNKSIFPIRWQRVRQGILASGGVALPSPRKGES